jgi:hypothetical protein
VQICAAPPALGEIAAINPRLPSWAHNFVPPALGSPTHLQNLISYYVPFSSEVCGSNFKCADGPNEELSLPDVAWKSYKC